AMAAGIKVPGQGSLLGRRGNESPRALPTAGTKVRAHVSAGSARVVVSQVFVNPHKDPIEAFYVFPLPHQAAVKRAEVTIGRRVIRGRIAARKQARDAYRRARAAGTRAIRVDQERDNVFTQAVSSVPGGGRVTVELEYVVPLRLVAGQYQLSYPIVVGPRSVPGIPNDEIPVGGGRLPDTNRVPDASRVTPPVLPAGLRSGRKLDIRVIIDEGSAPLSVKSPSHRIRVRKLDGKRREARLVSKKRIANRDFVIRYRVASKPALVVHENPDGSGFVGVTVRAPAQARRSPLSRYVVVIDDSSSMDGVALASGRRLAGELVASLDARLKFAIVPLSGKGGLGLGPISAARRRAAGRYLARMRTRRLVDPLPAIRKALRLAGDSGAVVLISDGWFANERELARLVDRAGARVFVVGLGSAPNRYLGGLLAAAGKGFADALAPGEDPGRLAAELASVAVMRAAKVIIKWPTGVHSQTPRPIPTLYPRRAVRVFARFDQLPKRASAMVRIDGGLRSKRASVMWLNKGQPNPALPSLWARQRIAGLELDEIRSGRSQATAIAKLGTEFSLLSRHTSFLAIDEGGSASRASRTVYVPVDAPAGTSRRRIMEDSELDLEGVREDESKKKSKGSGRRPRRTRGEDRTRVAKDAQPPPTVPDAGAAEFDDDDGEAEEAPGGDEATRTVDVTTTSGEAAYVQAGRGLQLSVSLSAGALFAGDERAGAARLAFGISLPIVRRLSLGAELSATAPLGSDVPVTFSLAPTVQLGLSSRLALAIAFGPSITSDGDLAGLAELITRYRIMARLDLELRLQRLLLDGTDANSATLGVGFSF
ncbi:MAG: hypothetical protein KJO07_15395, partial [Deltaproteobacteria bacterium]|nr:hypothetical protein [Deltaproteobacteria bacterium]